MNLNGSWKIPCPSLKAFLLALLVFLGPLSFWEGTLRYSGFRFDPYKHYKRFGANFESDEIRYYNQDSELFWRLRPAQAVRDWWVPEARINSKGFRGPEFDWEKGPGVFRVVCLGDSGTFGWGIRDHETYPARLQELLQKEMRSREVEVINMGVPGYSSHQGLILLKRHITRMSPDVIIFSFGRNDHNDTVYLTDRERRSYPDFLVHLHNALLPFRFYQWVYKWRALSMYQVNAQGFVVDGQQQKVRVPLKDYEDNLRTVAQLAGGAGARLVFVPRSQWPEYDEVMRRVASEERAGYVDLGSARQNAGLQAFMRGEHPGPGVYSHLALEIVRRIQSHGS